MIEWWQNLPAQMSPILFSIGSFSVHWYSIMYIIAIGMVYGMMQYRRNKKEVSFTKDHFDDFAFWAVLGVIFGGRLGYVLFYDLSYFMENPIRIISPFNEAGDFTGLSGMSYHGGMIGVILAGLLFTLKNKLNFLELIDAIAPAVPIAYTFGRLGNFINGELYGRVTTHPLGMYFASAGEKALRHPSQLYEGFFEGIVLFAIMWPLRNKFAGKWGTLTGIYIFGYGFFRFFIEYVREPDAHLGFVFMQFSMGQVLCFAMMLAGLIFIAVGNIRFGKKRDITSTQ